MRSLSAVALVSAIMFIVAGGSAANASCVQPNLADQVARADVIAYGTVSRSIQLPIFPPARQVRFRPERVLKGVAASEMNVAIGPDGSAATSVDYQADDGTAHTLYLRRTGETYSTDACSGSHPGMPTAEETMLLGQGGLTVAYDHPAAGWALPATVAAAAVLVGAGAALLWRRRRRTVNAQSR